MRQVKTIQDVVDWGLCIGCGACYYACTKRGVTLVNIDSVGIRPTFESACESCTACLSICPGYSVDGDLETGSLPKQSEADYEFGPALEIWEGYATDSQTRYLASSGGILSALALYCIERENMAFALHVGMDQQKPWLNKTVKSRSRSEILARAASRYSPASPCEGLAAIENSDRPCVFIGKPCDAAAVAMLRRQRPELDRRLGLVLTFFCAGTPSTQGTHDLLKVLSLTSDEINALHYRGQGWPGRFRVLYNNRVNEKSLSYNESWGKLTGYRPFRCHLCPDGLGRVADLSCGDAWENLDNGHSTGHSIVVVRTQRGQRILRRAMAAKYVELKRVTAKEVLTAQPNLLQRRRELFGRLLAMRLLLIPTPAFAGFTLFRTWIRLPFFSKLRTILGTLKRLILRGLWRARRDSSLPGRPKHGVTSGSPSVGVHFLFKAPSRGIVNLLRPFWTRCNDVAFNIKTTPILRYSTWRGESSQMTKHDDNYGYASPDYWYLRKILKILNPGPGEVFYDLGSGMGRVPCVMARRRLQKCVGIEVFGSLCQIAEQNALRVRGKQSPVEVVCGDSATADLSEGTVYFMFNPFGPATMRDTLNNIKRSLSASPRAITLVYCNPVHKSVLEDCGWLRQFHQFTTFGGSQVSFWKNDDTRHV